MNENIPQPKSSQSKSLWLIGTAWAGVILIIVWVLVSYFVIKPQKISLLDLVIWGMLMLINLGLFIVGFITSWFDFFKNRKTADLVLKRKLFRRLLWSLPGLLMVLLLIFLLGFLIFSVMQSIFSVR